MLPTQFPRSVLEEMCEAANWAPTHGITEPWRFVILQGEAIERLNQLKVEHTKATLPAGACLTGPSRTMQDRLRWFIATACVHELPWQCCLCGAGSEKLTKQLAKLEAKGRQLANCSALIAICLKRVPNKKGELMPEWEEVASIAASVQNMHLVLASQGDGLAGYWSSGGCADFNDGWGNSPEAKKMFGMDGECKGEPDRVLGIFHVGVTQEQRYEQLTGPKYGRTPTGEWSSRVKWLS